MRNPLPKPMKREPGPAIPPEQQGTLLVTLASQVSALGDRLEALRQQGAGRTSEFIQLEQMLKGVSDKITLAQSRLLQR